MVRSISQALESLALLPYRPADCESAALDYFCLRIFSGEDLGDNQRDQVLVGGLLKFSELILNPSVVPQVLST